MYIQQKKDKTMSKIEKFCIYYKCIVDKGAVGYIILVVTTNTIYLGLRGRLSALLQA